MGNDLVSIIIPVYNVEKYIERCICSVINQTYKDLQIIIINDGSTDNSDEVCMRYSMQDNRIKYIKKTNEGLGLTRNYGLNIATGKYVSFVDSDDYLDNNFVKNCIDYMKKYDSDTIITGYSKVSDGGKIFETEVFDEIEYCGEQVRNILLPRMLGSSVREKDSIRPMVWANLYSMKIINEHQLRFCNERELMSEDVYFDIEYYCYADSVRIIPCVGYYYRYNRNSITSSYRLDLLEKIKIMYKYESNRIKVLYDREDIQNRIRRQNFVYLRQCISQEIKAPNYNAKNCIKRIKSIITDSFVVELLEKYPVYQVSIKPRIFLLLCKSNQAFILYILAKLKVI